MGSRFEDSDDLNEDELLQLAFLRNIKKGTTGSSEPRSCQNCGAEGAKIPCSNKCGGVNYCSKECARFDAASHRRKCITIKEKSLADIKADNEEEDDSEPEQATDSDSDGVEDENQDSGTDSDVSEEEVKPQRRKQKGQGRKETVKSKAKPRRKRKSARGQTGESIIVMTEEEKQKLAQELLRRIETDGGLARRVVEQIQSGSFFSDSPMKSMSLSGVGLSFSADKSKSSSSEIEREQDNNPQNMSETDFEPVKRPGGSRVEPSGGMNQQEAASAPGPGPGPGSGPDLWQLRMVVWEGGNLGLSFHSEQRYPVISSLSDDSLLRETDICAGDKLITINGVEMLDVQPEVIGTLLQEVSRPAVLRFATECSKPPEYLIQWEAGCSLGVVFKSDGHKDNLPLVHRTNKTGNTIASKTRICAGDILLAVGDVPTPTYDVALSLLKRGPPAQLRFLAAGCHIQQKGDSSPAQGQSAGSSSNSKLKEGGDLSPPGDTSSSALTPFEYQSFTVNWTGGPLGFTFAVNSPTLPTIHRRTGKAVCPNLDTIQIGDELVAVGSKALPQQDCTAGLMILKAAVKPVDLVFRRKVAIKALAPVATPTEDTVKVVPAASSVFPRQSIPEEAPFKTLPSPSRPLPVVSPQLSTPSKGNALTLPEPQAETPRPLWREQSTPAPDKKSQSQNSSLPEYVLVWDEGPLGITFGHIEGITFISKVHNMGAGTRLPPNACGNRLMSVNDRPVSYLEMEDIIHLMKNAPKPCRLRFQVDSLSEEVILSSTIVNSLSPTGSSEILPVVPDKSLGQPKPEYSLVWTEGSLGLTLACEDEVNGPPFIKSVHGLGASISLSPKSIGDILVAVNGVRLYDLQFDDVMNLLKTTPKPLLLTFQYHHE